MRKQSTRKYEYHASILSDHSFIGIPKLQKATFCVLGILHGQKKHANRVCNAAACVSLASHTRDGRMDKSLLVFLYNFLVYPVCMRVLLVWVGAGACARVYAPDVWALVHANTSTSVGTQKTILSCWNVCILKKVLIVMCRVY
jgi:hypothetical protein